MSNEQATVRGKGDGAPVEGAGDNKGRGADGKFSFGNKGGPGNPFARQVAQLRKALVDVVTVEKIQAIATKLLELAEAGNVQAAKLVFAYVLGKPGAIPEPDRLDVEEWQGHKETASMFPEMGGLMSLPYPELPLTMVRCTKDTVTQDLAAMVGDVALHPEKYQPERVELVAGRGTRGGKEIGAGEFQAGGGFDRLETGRHGRGGPSANGVFSDDAAGVAVAEMHGKKLKSNGKNGRQAAGAPMGDGKLESPEWERILRERMTGGLK